MERFDLMFDMEDSVDLNLKVEKLEKELKEERRQYNELKIKYDKIEDDYKYLTKMPMDAVTEENIEKLLKEKKEKEEELEKIKTITINRMWMNELEELRKFYIEYKEERNKVETVEKKTEKKKSEKRNK